MAAPNAPWSARALQRVATRYSSRTARCTTSTIIVGRSLHRVSTPDALPTGENELRFEFEPTGQADLPHGRGAPGRCSSTSTGALVADADTPVTTPFVLNPGGLTCGANPGSPVTLDYPSPFRFTGTLRKVTVDVSGEGGWALLGSNQ